MSRLKKAKCAHCKKEFEYYPKATRGKYCSNKCKLAHVKTGKKLKCKVCKKTFYLKGYAIKRGRGKTCSKACHWKYIQTDEYKELLSKATSKEDLRRRPDLIRRRWKARKWAKAVIERDKKCMDCGWDRKLHAHHIKCVRKYPKLIYRMSNGITLCEHCHMRMERKNNNWSTKKNDNTPKRITKAVG